MSATAASCILTASVIRQRLGRLRTRRVLVPSGTSARSRSPRDLRFGRLLDDAVPSTASRLERIIDSPRVTERPLERDRPRAVRSQPAADGVILLARDKV